MSYNTCKVKNIDSSDHTYCGQVLEPDDIYQIQDQERVNFANNSDLLDDIADDKAQIGDGTNWFTDTNDQINWLKYNISQEVLLGASDDGDHWANLSTSQISGQRRESINALCHGTDKDGQDISPTGELIYPFPSSAEQMSVVSDSTDDVHTSGSGARSIRIYYLDSDYAEAYEDVALNSTTPVTTTASMLRINQVMVTTAGSHGTNKGNITIKNGSDVLVKILKDYGADLNSTFTIPAGKSAFLLCGRFSFSRQVPCEGKCLMRPYGGAWFSAYSFVTANGDYDKIFKTFATIPEKTDIKVWVAPGSQGNTSALFYELMLRDN